MNAQIAKNWVAWRNLVLTTTIVILYFCVSPKVSSQAPSSGPCGQSEDNCLGNYTTQYNSCVAGCGGNSSCISNCAAVEKANDATCSSQYSTCIADEKRNCGSGNGTNPGCPGNGNSQLCIYTQGNETCYCNCACYGGPPPCPSPWCVSGSWVCNSPIVIDAFGEGFHLTNAANGVFFDLWADAQSRRFAWTDAAYHNAWLALDRNGNGTIDDGSELFGSATPQPDPPAGYAKNGFNALTVYDQPANGGNGDGVISASDAVFNRLLLWIDANHDGVSQPAELHSLSELHVDSISLDYAESDRKDQYGNAYFYRSRVRDAAHKILADRFAWDVYLQMEQ